jgi:probable poly-beta-1,6-N-acetyl-D-glucosamine export protein
MVLLEKKPLRQKKPKIFEIDLLRFIAIIAVVLIHSTADATVEPAEGSLSQIMFYAMNRASQFAVPLFIMISGMVLFYRYEEGWSLRTALDFYRKRILSVAVPYLIWMFLYELFYQWVYDGQVEVKFGEFLEKLPWADVGYHLYFMIIILQFYLLFPILMSAVNRWPFLRKHMATIAIALHGGFYMYKFYFADLKHGPSLFATYIGYFLIGGFIGLYYDKIRNWKPGVSLGFGLLAVLAGGAFTGFFLASRYKHLYAHNNWYELTTFIYVTSLFLFLLWLGRLVFMKRTALNRVIAVIGASSFGIYLVHPALLSLFKMNVKSPGPIWQYDLYTLSCFLTVFTGSLLLSFLYGKTFALLKGIGTRSKPASPRGRQAGRHVRL